MNRRKLWKLYIGAGLAVTICCAFGAFSGWMIAGAAFGGAMAADFRESILEELPAFVVVAGENPEQNHRIAKLCQEKRIPVNVVDDQEYCSFIFPSLISHGNLSVGICTNGASPATGVLLKRKIEDQIPDNIEEILDFYRKNDQSLQKG